MKKILFFQWNALMQKDVEEALLDRNDVELDCVSYEFADWDKDEYFERKFPAYLLKKRYDMVFSINYFPVVSDVCDKYNIPYISWVYDAPMHIKRKETIGNSVNCVFVFDRGQYKDLREAGYNTVYHMPLGANTKRLDSMEIREEDKMKFSSKVSFMGKLYENDLEYLLKPLPTEYRNEILSIVDEQKKTYGNYFLNEKLTPELLSKLNKFYGALSSGGQFRVKKEELEYACATYITQQERLEALEIVSECYPMDLYSYNKIDGLSKVNCKGFVKYYSEMPKMFRLSDINLNISLKIIKEGIPLRVFDILGAGGFLITNYQKEIDELFTIGKDLVVYENMQDLKEKVGYYLEHEEERREIAKNGHDKVAKLYSIESQIDKILKTLDKEKCDGK